MWALIGVALATIGDIDRSAALTRVGLSSRALYDVVTFIVISSMEGYYKLCNNTSENGATNLWLPRRRELWNLRAVLCSRS
jgi:hypothetical protein